VAKRARQEHYPAPYAIIDQWQNYGGNTLAVPADEPTSLDALVRHPTTRNLIRVFFLQDRLKGFGKGAPDFAPRHVHVIGAGVMGGDVAAWCVLRGMTVTLQDQTIERIAPAVGRAAKLPREEAARQRKLARFALDRLIADPSGRRRAPGRRHHRGDLREPGSQAGAVRRHRGAGQARCLAGIEHLQR
jgi:3-hydroxyacyl-CoA dehydrogenase/enoyl-CoA hydratase/3-hydroxybutyryl-CoA epimerase